MSKDRNISRTDDQSLAFGVQEKAFKIFDDLKTAQERDSLYGNLASLSMSQEVNVPVTTEFLNYLGLQTDRNTKGNKAPSSRIIADKADEYIKELEEKAASLREKGDVEEADKIKQLILPVVRVVRNRLEI